MWIHVSLGGQALLLHADAFYGNTVYGAWRMASGVFKAKDSGVYFSFGGGVVMVLLMMV